MNNDLCKYGKKNNFGVIMCEKNNSSCTFQKYCHQDCMWIQTNNYVSCPKNK